MYKITFEKNAKKEFDKLPLSIAHRIIKTVRSLAENPRPAKCIKLHGRENQYRVRVGDYRVLYIIKDNDLIVVIIKISHRKDVYR